MTGTRGVETFREEAEDVGSSKGKQMDQMKLKCSL